MKIQPLFQSKEIVSVQKNLLGASLLQVLLPFVLILFAGCGQQSAPAAPKAASNTYQNPVINSDFPDPRLLHAGNMYYAYATNASGKNVQVAQSSDLVHWDQLPDAMPTFPAWAQPGGSFIWVAQAIQIGNTYVLYFTARDQQSDKQCVGVATSDKPTGKFKDQNDHALVCQSDQGGTIDPRPFSDNEKLYLYFKNDGNCCSQPTYLYSQALSSDGLHVQGKPTQLMHNDQPWEGKVTEAPDMFKHNGKYYLFFSANNYAGDAYSVGYASCQTPTGPCQQAAENPILASRMTKKPLIIGPGGESLLQVGNETWMAYHKWDVTPDGVQGSNRVMCLDRVTWQDDKPHIQPTTDPQPVPHI